MLWARIKLAGPVLPMFIVAHFTHHVASGSLIPLLPWLRDAFQLDYTRSGMLLSSFALTYGFAQLPMASLADRWSKTTMIGVGLVGVSLSAIAASLSPGYYFLLATLILMGLFGSTYHAPTSSFLSQWFSQEQRGRVLGTHLVGGSTSLLFTPVAAVLIARFTGDWRYSFMALAIPAFFSGLTLILVGRGYEKTSLAKAAKGPKERVNPIEIVRLIGGTMAIALFSQLVTSGIYSFLPLFLVDKHQVSREIAGMMVGLVSGAGIIGGPLGGALSDRFGRKPVIMLSIVLVGPLVLLLTVVPFGWPMVGVILLYGFCGSFRMPTIESLIADTVPWHRRATALAVYFFVSQETAAVSMPVIGWFIDAHGLTSVFTTLALIALSSSVLVLSIRKRI
ncbi:MAG: MFS transporter [Dehalococcoidia bacterium]|nr:MFS transporter [Dehalococcoidia bacterium]